MLSALRSLGSPRARVIDCLIAQKIREWLYCPSGTVLSAFLSSVARRAEKLVNRDGSLQDESVLESIARDAD